MRGVPTWILVILFCLLIAGGSFFLYTYFHGFNSQVSNETLSTSTASRTVNPADQKYATIIADKADVVAAAIKNKDGNILASFISPTVGLRLSPYAEVKYSDQVLYQQKVANFFTDNTTYTWGSYTGSGVAINLTPSAYYNRFIYDSDFANVPTVSYNRTIGVSGITNNASQFYPGSIIVEYYSKGINPAYNGMDWESLRLVFSEKSGTWYLVGIIHDQWSD